MYVAFNLICNRLTLYSKNYHAPSQYLPFKSCYPEEKGWAALICMLVR